MFEFDSKIYRLWSLDWRPACCFCIRVLSQWIRRRACTVRRRAGSRCERTLRVCSLTVFTVAEFYMEYQLVYVAPSCDQQLFDLKSQHVHEFVCRKSVERCPFHTTASCHQLTTNVRLYVYSHLINIHRSSAGLRWVLLMLQHQAHSENRPI